MKILGIHDSHDSGAAIIENGKILAAVNEERLNRDKLCWGFPNESIKEVLRLTNLKPSDIDYIAVATHYSKFVPKTLKFAESNTLFSYDRQAISTLSKFLWPLFQSQIWLKIQKLTQKPFEKKRKNGIKHIFRKKFKFKCPIMFIEHHLCHAASAYYTSGKQKTTIITSDAAGDALSTTVSIGINGKIKRIFELSSYNSIAKFYSYITILCGFKSNKHEGKITGLAAHGKPLYFNLLQNMIRYKNGKIINYSKTKNRSSLEKIKKLLPKDWKKEDLASTVQVHLEKNFSKFTRYWVNKTQIKDVVLAGGLFANVKLNQAIHELDNVNSVFIHPHMGDGGIGVGAALYLWAKLNNWKVKIPKLRDVYFGPEFTNKEIEKELKKEKIKYNYFKNIEKEIAKLLAKGEVVAVFNGKMEYGPRALGSRSILYQTTDKTVNDWLNKNLRRTEFMPFAPSSLVEYSNKLYKNVPGAEYPAEFMTITFICTPWMVKRCPGVVHLDNTARPQTVDKKVNPCYYKIIDEYRKLTGLPVVINTSFNIHEEPIVCTPYDAIRAFKIGHLGYLAMGNFLSKFEDQKNKK